MSDSDPSGPSPAPALAIVNARVFTGDSLRPWADAVLVRDDVVLAVGPSAAVRKRAGAGATLIDARGMLVLPRSSEGRLAPGLPANLVIVARAAGGEPSARVEDDAVIFSLVEGRVVVDRDSLAR